MDYTNFKNACELYGKKNGYDVKVMYCDLSRYGLNDWFCASFMVDRFGGDACEIAFINGAFRYTSALIGTKYFDRLDECFDLVPADMENEAEARQGVEMFNND